MMWGFNILKNYALDFGIFYRIRNFKDGITFFEFTTNLDLYKADHNPRFKINLILINYLIFDINIYNTAEHDFGYD